MSDTATHVPEARALPLTAWGHLFLAETRMVVRDTAGLIIPVGMPLLMLVMNGLGNDATQELPGRGTVMDRIILPLTITMMVTLVGVVNMPSFLASYRKYGVLKRLAVTPARPLTILLAQAAVSLAQVLIGVALMLGVALAFFDARLPASLGWAVLVGVLLVAAMYAVGLLIAATSPTVNSAIAIGLVAFFAMLALGGGFGGVENLPDLLRRAGELLPYGACVEALGAAWGGDTPSARSLLVLGGWSVVAGGLAGRWFRWT